MTFQDLHAKCKVNKKERQLLLKQLRDLNLEKITAGIHSSEGKQVIDENGTRLIDIAVQNEYGNSWVMPKTVRFFKNGKWWTIKKGTRITIPATHFVTRIIQDVKERNSIIDSVKAYLHILIKYGKYGYTIKDFVKDVGTDMKNAIKRNIDEKIFKPNSPLTIAIKGFDKRLFEKGTLYNAIKYRSKKARVQG